MRSRLEAALKALRGTPAPRPDTVPVVVPLRDPFGDEAVDGRRREAAASMLDAGVCGYVLVRVCRASAAQADVRVDAEVAPALWPAVEETLARLVVAAGEHAHR